MKQAVIDIHLLHLATLLQLPQGATIADVRVAIDRPDVLQVRVTGVGEEVPLGHVIPRSVGVVEDFRTVRLTWPDLA